MALAISEKRYQQVRAGVEARRLAATVAEVEAIDWDRLPHFSDVSGFLTFLDRVQPTPARPVGRSGKA
jgi:hypothetical protein